MAYEVLMHSAPYASNVVVFMKALSDGAVYFKTPDGSRQYILNLPTGAAKARGGDVAMALRAMLINKNLKTTPAELNKAASAVISKNTIQHGYSFVYDDDDEESDYLEGHLQHHGILGMKWGVRRYQNSDGSLTDAGRKRYDKVASSPMQSKLDTSDALRISKKTSSYQAAKEKSSTKKADKYKKKADSEFDPIKKDKYLSKSKAAEKEAEVARKIKEEYSKLFKDISEGSVKAGRDFVVQRDIEAHLLMPVSYIDYYKTLENHPDQEYQMNPWIGGIRRTIVKKK